MNEKQVKRLYRFIEEENVPKLASYFSKHEQNLLSNPNIFAKRRNVLHIACKLLKADSAHLLMKKLKEKAPRFLQAPDRKGNLPIHLALKTVLKLEGNVFNFGYHDVVIPVLRSCPTILLVMNKKGESIRSLLEKVEKKKDEITLRGYATNRRNTPHSQSGRTRSEEDVWNEKLKGEYEDEYNMSWGQYEDDFGSYEQRRHAEHYDEWAERIQKEYKKKRTQEREKHYKSTKKPKEDIPKWTKEDQEKFEAAERKLANERIMREAEEELAYKKAHFANQLSRLEEANLIRLEDMSFFVTAPVKDIVKLLVSDVQETKERENALKLLKKKQIFWHPDKFAQKFGQRIAEDVKETTMKRVTEISQCLNSYEF